MKVVVKKSPKFLRGFLKLIFGIKSNCENYDDASDNAYKNFTINFEF